VIVGHYRHENWKKMKNSAWEFSKESRGKKVGGSNGTKQALRQNCCLHTTQGNNEANKKKKPDLPGFQLGVNKGGFQNQR